MATLVSRRAVIQMTPALALVPALAASPAAARHSLSPRGGAPSLPQLDPALVREIVGVSHSNLDRVKELLNSHPELAKAAVDWGFGDWEAALGAASHTGQREIALLLIEHGARPDIFTFAMLGHTAAVKTMVEAHPGVQRILGPHGISLAQHARAGGDNAKETYDYLISLGDADTAQARKPTTPEERAACAADYITSDGQKFSIVDEKNSLHFKAGDSFKRGLLYQGDYLFHPVGAPSVNVLFTLKDGKAASVTIRDGELLAEATRA